ncbi:MAG: HAD family hydrolase [Phycisphaerae bacterium]|nr:HAD family hydrolase [Phycisphaerae bacterium]
MMKAVLFDFGQTLVDSADAFRQAEKQVQKNIFNNLALHDWEEFLAQYRRIRKEHHAKSELSRMGIWRDVYLHFHNSPDATLLETWERDYWKTVEKGTVVFPEAESVLAELSGTYKLAIITNTQGQRESEAHRLSLFPRLKAFFQTVIVAGQAGIPPKPDATPFHMCLDTLGVSPREAVYVGDDWHNDICGAKDVGIQPIWLQHHLVKRNWPRVETTVPVITSLEEIRDYEENL